MKIIHTPWGAPDHTRIVADGIVEVVTPSHGGFVLSQERAEELRQHLPGFQPWTGTATFLEEDCDWAAVAVLWPQYFEPLHVKYAVKSMENRQDVPEAFFSTGRGSIATSIANAVELSEAS